MLQELFHIKYSGTFKDGKMDGEGVYYFEVFLLTFALNSILNYVVFCIGIYKKYIKAVCNCMGDGSICIS
jgi:hypothetical protein